MTITPSEMQAYADAYAGRATIDLKEACDQSLMELTEYLWDIVDPGEELVGGWAMDSIAEHLEATYYGHIKRLLITVPPGFSKSSLCNVFFPLWVWIKKPHQRFIHASYEEGIPERDNLKCRNIIQHEKFQRFWGDKFKLSVPNTIDKFENDKRGFKMATSVGAKLIGHRGNYIIIDDPNDPDIEKQESAKRIRAVRWFRETVPTRLNKMSRDKIIVIQQRLHAEDVAGTALGLTHEGYVHLNIPMEWEPRLYFNGWAAPDEDNDDEDEPDQIVTLYDEDARQALRDDPECIFWRDPRTVENQLAWPERFSRKTVEKLKKTLDSTMVAAQLQQRPVPRGGNIIKTEHWKTYKEEKYPKCSFVLATLDTAYTEETKNDPSGMTIWGLFHDEYQNPKILLIYAWKGWFELDELVRRCLHTCTYNDINYGEDMKGLPRYPVDALVIEGKASGMSVQQEISRLLSLGQGRTLFVDMVPSKDLRSDKRNRLVSVSHLFQNGMIYAPDKEFADDVIVEVCEFPSRTHDEYVDCTAHALRWFRDRGFAPTREELFEDEAIEKAFRPSPPPLYGGT